jgi:hypothetical protein
MLTTIQVFRDCGVYYKWKIPHKKSLNPKHLVDITTLQPHKKSGRIVARPQASMAKEGGSSMSTSKANVTPVAMNSHLKNNMITLALNNNNILFCSRKGA